MPTPRNGNFTWVCTYIHTPILHFIVRCAVNISILFSFDIMRLRCFVSILLTVVTLPVHRVFFCGCTLYKTIFEPPGPLPPPTGFEF